MWAHVNMSGIRDYSYAANSRQGAVPSARISSEGCLYHLSVCTFNYVSGMLKGAQWSEKLEQSGVCRL